VRGPNPRQPWRRALWTAGAPARALLIAVIRLYRVSLSGWFGGECRFSPTCSEYALGAIASHGALKGTALAAWRITRCNPFGAGGMDPVPTGTAHGYENGYENVIHRSDA
jgi:putative membrane protein insertion efficiency factor